MIFTLNAPNAFWANTLAGALGFIASPTATEEFGADYARNPVGTGPFSLEDYDNLVLKKNPNYWKKDEAGNQLPYLDEIKIEPIPDSKVRLQSLRSGDIDMFQTADTDNIVDVVKGGDDFKIQKVTGTSSTIVLFNLEQAALRRHPHAPGLRLRPEPHRSSTTCSTRARARSPTRRSTRTRPSTPRTASSRSTTSQKAKKLVAELKADGKSVDFTAICIPTDESRRLLGSCSTR